MVQVVFGMREGGYHIAFLCKVESRVISGKACA